MESTAYPSWSLLISAYYRSDSEELSSRGTKLNPPTARIDSARPATFIYFLFTTSEYVFLRVFGCFSSAAVDLLTELQTLIFSKIF